MLVTTTDQVEGYPVSQYLGVVSGETVAGINALKDFGAGVRNVFGGRAEGYENELIKARLSAYDEMVARAHRMGAEGIVGVRYAYTTMGQGNMLMVSITGTAVRFTPVR
ncbi:YbjQ family protein [Gleimia sp. 6138-11-ORH1]|uniref:YbjQ family protein n=1 Tax=Gleimia sp. 6138-11-ORH1 TaxID=2973937 RepID=UPI0021695A1D|nr:YbjQ family protein [Gleimia sp. 6138-11-ORH1]MCS4484801.1 YbjQ family protein [Gleimia sp. 6138-11-ORH1]